MLAQRKIAKKYKFDHDEDMLNIVGAIIADNNYRRRVVDIIASSDLAKHDYLIDELIEYFNTQPKGSKVIVFASFRLTGQ